MAFTQYIIWPSPNEILKFNTADTRYYIDAQKNSNQSFRIKNCFKITMRNHSVYKNPVIKNLDQFPHYYLEILWLSDPTLKSIVLNFKESDKTKLITELKRICFAELEDHYFKFPVNATWKL